MSKAVAMIQQKTQCSLIEIIKKKPGSATNHKKLAEAIKLVIYYQGQYISIIYQESQTNKVLLHSNAYWPVNDY